MAVLFVGTDTQVTDVYGIKTEKQFINTLEDNIPNCGAPRELISDRAQVIISNKVQYIILTLCIKIWRLEPHQQQQTPAKRRYQRIKRADNSILDRSGPPDYTWILSLQYVFYLLNHAYNDTLNAVTLQLLSGVAIDIIPLLRFHFCQKVSFKSVDNGFPLDSVEILGRVVGISEHCSHALTYKVLNSKTLKVIYCSLLCLATPDDINVCAESLGGESNDVIHLATTFIKISRSQAPHHFDTSTNRNYRQTHWTHITHGCATRWQHICASIVKIIEDHNYKLENNKDRIKFLLSVNKDNSKEVITYNQLLDYLVKEDNNEVIWKFQRITSHQGPLTTKHPNYKGSTYKIMVEWENGDTKMEPLQIIAKDDPVTCAIYAKDNGYWMHPDLNGSSPLPNGSRSIHAL
jgi:hypothetical protein